MKYLKLVAVCLAFGLFVDTCAAEEKPQRPERRIAGPQADGPQRRDPGAMASKMMSEFDKNGDSMLNVEELTAMFTMMKERAPQGRAGQGRGDAGSRRPEAGKGPAGQGRAAGRPGSDRRPDQLRGEKAEQGKRDRPEDARRKRPQGQRGGPEQDQAGKPGGKRPNRPETE